MKTAFVFALAALSVTAQADADRIYTIVSCYQTGIADAGVMVSIQSGGFTGLTTAHVSEQSIMGPRPVGQVVVRETSINRPNKPTVYSGESLELVIYTNRAPRNGGVYFDGQLSGEIEGHQYNDRVACQFRRHPM